DQPGGAWATAGDASKSRFVGGDPVERPSVRNRSEEASVVGMGGTLRAGILRTGSPGREGLYYTRMVCIIPRPRGGRHPMRRRVNVSLSEESLRLMDRAGAGNRSRFIEEAIRVYVLRRGRSSLARALKEGALRRADEDLATASEWFPLEDEAWRKRRK